MKLDFVLKCDSTAFPAMFEGLWKEQFLRQWVKMFNTDYKRCDLYHKTTQIKWMEPGNVKNIFFQVHCKKMSSNNFNSDFSGKLWCGNDMP